MTLRHCGGPSYSLYLMHHPLFLRVCYRREGDEGPYSLALIQVPQNKYHSGVALDLWRQRPAVLPVTLWLDQFILA
jgi:hypothetical protein